MKQTTLTTVRVVALLLFVGYEISEIYLALIVSLLIVCGTLRRRAGGNQAAREYWALVFFTLLFATLYAKFVV